MTDLPTKKQSKRVHLTRPWGLSVAITSVALLALAVFLLIDRFLPMEQTASMLLAAAKDKGRETQDVTDKLAEAGQEMIWVSESPGIHTLEVYFIGGYKLTNLRLTNPGSLDREHASKDILITYLDREGQPLADPVHSTMPAGQDTLAISTGSPVAYGLRLSIESFEGKGPGLADLEARGVPTFGPHPLASALVSFALAAVLVALVFKRQRALYIAFAVILLSCLLAASSVMLHEGWPDNHESLSWKYRNFAYTNNFLEGVLVPLWLPGDFHGMGSPMPTFYHRLFVYVSATLQMVLVSYKQATLAAVLLFMAVGSAGLYRLSRALGAPELWAIALAATFPHLNYSVTDWIVRGAFAEFSALALVPWLLDWCVRSISDRKLGLSIAPLMALLFLAHSVIAFYGLLPCALAYVVVCYRAPLSLWLSSALRGALAAILALALLMPFLLPLYKDSDNFSLSQIAEGRFNPVNRYEPLLNYFYNAGYKWWADREAYNVQLDGWLTGGIILALVLGAILSRRSPAAPEGTRESSSKRHAAFLLLSLGLMLFFQTPLSAFIYNHVPGFSMIQVPWRLLSYMTIILAALFVISLKRVEGSGASISNLSARHMATGLLLLSCLGLLATNPSLREIKAKWFTPAEVETEWRMTSIMGWYEYIPYIKLKDTGKEMDREVKVSILEMIAKMSPETVEGKPCVARENLKKRRLLYRSYAIKCEDGKATIALPLSYSANTVVELSAKGGKPAKVSHHRVDTDPRMRIAIPETGGYEAHVTLPAAIVIGSLKPE